MSKEINGYALTRSWYQFKFENTSRCRSIHSDLYFFCLYLWNDLGQPQQFGLPTTSTMQALGIGSYNTYKKALSDIVEFGFLEIVQEAKNQWQAKIIALSKSEEATDKALDRANKSALSKSEEATDKATDKATDTIKEYKNYKNTKNLKNSIKEEASDEAESQGEFFEVEVWPTFDDFWDAYQKKTKRDKCEKKWEKISQNDREKIMEHVPEYVESTPEKQYRLNPETYLNNKCWNDEIIRKNRPEQQQSGYSKKQDHYEFEKIINDLG